VTRPLLALAIALVGAFSFACGGDDAETQPTAVPTIDEGRATDAKGMLPDLTALGFTLGENARISGATSSQDAYFGIYEKPGAGPVSGARIEINFLPRPDIAVQQFVTLADALRNPPADLFGPDATQVDNQIVFQASQSRSYVTTKPDGQGNYVFTDAYRYNQAVVIIYTIGKQNAETNKIRQDIATEVGDLAPR